MSTDERLLPKLDLKLQFRQSVSHDPSPPERSQKPCLPRVNSLPQKPRRAGFKPMNLDHASPKLPRTKEASKGISQMEAKVTGRMGTLTLNGQVYNLSMGDVESLGKIGSGVTGEVFTVKYKPTGQIMAAKKMTWVDKLEERKRVLMDLDVMAQHKSPHIVKYYGSLISNNDVWVFMELMSTCLDRLLKKLNGPVPEDIVCKVAVAVVKALDYLKTEHKIIHRDVKPSNILLDLDGNVKLCDFGISGRLVDSQAFTRGAGCVAYMAPERIDLLNGKPGYDVRADIWSLGVSLVELATGSLPYDCSQFSTEFHLLTHIVEAPPPLPDRDTFSASFYNFVSQCLTKDVDRRPYYADLLKHDLIKEYELRTVDVGSWLKTVI